MAAADTDTDVALAEPAHGEQPASRPKLKPGPKVSARQLQARARVHAYKKANPKKRGPKLGSKNRKRAAILPLATTATATATGSTDTPTEYASLAIKPSPRRRGPPSLCTPEIFAEICARMASGEFLTRICEEPEFPSYYSILRWMGANPESRSVYNEIRRSQAQWWVEKGALLVAEATDPRTANLIRVKVDTFKYLAAKIDPDNWADKTGAGANVTVNILTQERAGTARKVLLADLDALASGKHIIDVEPEAPAFEG